MDQSTINKQYLEVFPKMKGVLDLVRHKLNVLSSDQFKIILNFKPFESIKNKANKDKVDHITEMSDLVRGQIYFSENYSFSEIISLIKRIFKEFKCDVDKKRTMHEYGLDYSGIIHLDFEIEGINVELQLIPMEFYPYRDILHQVYEQLRSPFAEISDVQRKFLAKMHNKLYYLLKERAEHNRESFH